MLVWLENNNVFYETDKERAAVRFNITRDPDYSYTEEEWEAIHGMARVIDGKYTEGWTAEEIAAQEESEKQREIQELSQRLAETDYVAVKIAEGAATKEEYADVLAERAKCRARINELRGK